MAKRSSENDAAHGPSMTVNRIELFLLTTPET
jgi:hypothetical protein